MYFMFIFPTQIEVYVTKYIETEEHFRGEEQKLERMARQLDSLIPEFGNPDGKAEATQKGMLLRANFLFS